MILKFSKIFYLYYFWGSKHRWHHKDCFDNQISFWNYIFSSVKLSFENCSSQAFLKQNTWTLSLNIKEFGIACFWKYITVLLFQVSHWNWSTELRQSHVIYRQGTKYGWPICFQRMHYNLILSYSNLPVTSNVIHVSNSIFEDLLWHLAALCFTTINQQ